MEPVKPFSKDSSLLPLETEADRILNKMKRITRSKTKQNYKKIDELENIYESNASGGVLGQMNDFAKGMRDLQKNLEILEKEMENVEGFTPDDTDGVKDEEGFEDEEEGFEDEEEGFEDEEEGFATNLSNGLKIYTSEYENNTSGGIYKLDKTLYKKLFKLAKQKQLTKSQLKALLKSGDITQSQYDKLIKAMKSKKSKKTASSGKCKSNRFKEYIDIAVKYVTKFYTYYYKYLQKLAKQIYNKTDGVIDDKRIANNQKDIDIIAEQINYFLAVPSAIIYAYNWYYIILYKDENNQKIPYTFGDTLNSFVNNGVLKYLFTALIQPVILLNAFLRKTCPAVIDQIIDFLGYFKFGKYLDFTILKVVAMNPIAQFMVLVCVILYLSCKYSQQVFDAMISFMGHGSPPSYIKWLYVIVAYDIIIGVARRANTFFGTVQSTADKVNGFIKTLMSPFTSFAMWLVLVIFSFLNIRLAGLFIIIYLYINTYLAMGIYNGVNNKPSIAQAWSDMNTMFRKSVVNIGGRQCPPNPTFFEKLFVVLMELCYECMAYMLYFIILLYGIYRYVTELQSESTKIILSALNGFLLAIITVFIILRAKAKMMNPLNIDDYDNI